MRVLGIDPGSNATGFGLVERVGGDVVHVAHGVLRPPRGASLPQRLVALARGVAEVVVQHRPDEAVVERLFVAAHPRAALVLGQARGAILVSLAEAGLPIAELAPTEIKQSVTGSGSAGKDQVQRMVRQLLALPRIPAQDAGDALAAALCRAQAGRLARLDGVRGQRARRRSAATWVVRRGR